MAIRHGWPNVATVDDGKALRAGVAVTAAKHSASGRRAMAYRRVFRCELFAKAVLPVGAAERALPGDGAGEAFREGVRFVIAEIRADTGAVEDEVLLVVDRQAKVRREIRVGNAADLAVPAGGFADGAEPGVVRERVLRCDVVDAAGRACVGYAERDGFRDVADV